MTTPPLGPPDSCAGDLSNPPSRCIYIVPTIRISPHSRPNQCIHRRRSQDSVANRGDLSPKYGKKATLHITFSPFFAFLYSDQFIGYIRSWYVNLDIVASRKTAFLRAGDSPNTIRRRPYISPLVHFLTFYTAANLLVISEDAEIE